MNEHNEHLSVYLRRLSFYLKRYAKNIKQRNSMSQNLQADYDMGYVIGIGIFLGWFDADYRILECHEWFFTPRAMVLQLRRDFQNMHSLRDKELRKLQRTSSKEALMLADRFDGIAIGLELAKQFQMEVPS